MPFYIDDMKLGWNVDSPKLMAAMPNMGSYIIDKEFDLMMEKVPTANVWSLPVNKNGGYGMHLNDTYGDCTVATVANSIQTKTANAGSHMLIVPDKLVKEEYFGLTGGVDSGLMMDQVKKAGMVPGYFMSDDRYSDRLLAWAMIDPRNDHMVRFASYYFGGVDFGIYLPETAGWQIKHGKAWDYIATPTKEQGSNEPGSWGGHSVHVPDYASFGETCTTWQIMQPMTKAFRRNYVFFGAVNIDLNWFNAQHKLPVTGLAYKDLMSDMKKYLKPQ